MLTIAKRFQFHAAHSLPHHTGACKNLHGHTYELEVEICRMGTCPTWTSGPEQGMVADFGVLKGIVNETVINRFDHVHLNGLFNNPTAEEMIEYIWSSLNVKLSKQFIQLQSLRLWETDTSYAKRTRD